MTPASIGYCDEYCKGFQTEPGLHTPAIFLRYNTDMKNPLTQKVNFYISVAFIACFGFFITISVVQVLNPKAALVQHISSPLILGDSLN
jgi:hypothetical protein